MAKGKTASEEKKPEESKETNKPVWLKFSEQDVEAIVLKLAKQGLTSEKIGLVLRDSYGIPKAKLIGKKISQILKEHNLYKNASLTNLENKQNTIQKHIEKHKQDKKSKRACQLPKPRF